MLFGITFIHGAEGFLVIESTHSLDPRHKLG